MAVAAPQASASRVAQPAASAEALSHVAPPRFPYKASGNDPAAEYWKWFQLALGCRLRAAASQAGVGTETLLKDATAAGLIRACAEAFGDLLSESEMAHLDAAPVSAAWLKGILAEK